MTSAYRLSVLWILILLNFHFLYGQNSALHFDENGDFKIIQFTDIHWGDKFSSAIPWEDTKKSNPDETIELMKGLIESEKPDLVVLTGDIVTSPPVKEGWDVIASVFEEAEQSWTVALGNHDGRDAGLTRTEVFDILLRYPHFIGRKGEVESSVGNFEIPVWNRQKTAIASLIYILNSNNRPENEKYGSWDWIHYDQIEWYRKTRDFYLKRNGGKNNPALMFLHIPLAEFAYIEQNPVTFLGIERDRKGYTPINSGLFGSFLERKEMMGVFAGHYHNTDDIGIYNDVALGITRAGGAEAHSTLPRGARIIELKENQFEFQTQIKNLDREEPVFYFPSGISSKDENTLPYLPSLTDTTELKNGISYRYFEGGRFKETKDILKNGTLKKKGRLSKFSLKPAVKSDSIAFVFEGFIKIPKKAVYRFYTNSDDGSKLYIDDRLVVDNDGSHYTRRREGKVALQKGFHSIKVEYFQDYLGKKLEVGWISRFQLEEFIPEEVLYINHRDEP